VFCSVAWYRVVPLYRVESCHAVSCGVVVLCRAAPCRAMPCHAVQHVVTLVLLTHVRRGHDRNRIVVVVSVASTAMAMTMATAGYLAAPAAAVGSN